MVKGLLLLAMRAAVALVLLVAQTHGKALFVSAPECRDIVLEA